MTPIKPEETIKKINDRHVLLLFKELDLPYDHLEEIKTPEDVAKLEEMVKAKRKKEKYHFSINGGQLIGGYESPVECYCSGIGMLSVAIKMKDSYIVRLNAECFNNAAICIKAEIETQDGKKYTVDVIDVVEEESLCE